MSFRKKALSDVLKDGKSMVPGFDVFEKLWQIPEHQVRMRDVQRDLNASSTYQVAGMLVCVSMILGEDSLLMRAHDYVAKVSINVDYNEIMLLGTAYVRILEFAYGKNLARQFKHVVLDPNYVIAEVTQVPVPVQRQFQVHDADPLKHEVAYKIHDHILESDRVVHNVHDYERNTNIGLLQTIFHDLNMHTYQVLESVPVVVQKEVLAEIKDVEEEVRKVISPLEIFRPDFAGYPLMSTYEVSSTVIHLHSLEMHYIWH
jgi:hypothetical protein